MIIISNKPGQLGNRLIVFASFIALAKQYNLKIFNPSFDEYCKYFIGSNSLIASYSANYKKKEPENFNSQLRRVIYGFFYYLTRIINRVKLNNSYIKAICIDWEDYIHLERCNGIVNSNYKLVFVQGWKFRDKNLLVKHKEEVLNFFTPTEFYQNRISIFVEELKKLAFDCYIGIHIRRGDYKTFENGIYYYSDEEYIIQMKRMVHLLQNKRVCFLIFSNVEIDKDIFIKNNLNVAWTRL